MDIGTGIAAGCSILGGIAVMFKLFGSGKNGNPNVKSLKNEMDKKFDEVQWKDVCDERSGGIKELLTAGFKQINSRLDKLNNK